MIQDQSLVASKHFLVETEDKNLADPAVAHPGHGHGHRKADAKLPHAKLRSSLDKNGDDYWSGLGHWWWWWGK